MAFGDRRVPLARGKGLSRGEPLARTAGLARTRWVRRPPPPPVTPAPRERRRSAAPPDGSFSKRSRGLIYARDERCCVRCGRRISGVRGSIQHRRARAAGGTSLEWVGGPANGVLMDGTGTTGCHGWVEGEGKLEALAKGWRLSPNGLALPVDVPVLYEARREVRLLDDRGGSRLLFVLGPGETWTVEGGVR